MFLTLLAAAAESASAPVAPQSPVTGAVFVCVMHSTGAAPISSKYYSKRARNGYALVSKPPKTLANTLAGSIFPSWGKPKFLRPTGADEVWSVGFSLGNCLVDATGEDADKLKAAALLPMGEGTPWQRLPANEFSADRFSLTVTPRNQNPRNIAATFLMNDIGSGKFQAVVTFELY